MTDRCRAQNLAKKPLFVVCPCENKKAASMSGLVNFGVGSTAEVYLVRTDRQEQLADITGDTISIVCYSSGHYAPSFWFAQYLGKPLRK